MKTLWEKIKKVLPFIFEKISIIANSGKKKYRNVEESIVKKIVIPYQYRNKLEHVSRKNRELPTVLALRYKYAHGKKSCGVSNEEYCFSAPLKGLNIANVVEYYYDLDFTGGIFGGDKLVSMILETSPDLIILNSYSHENLKQPQFELLKAVRKICRIPVVFIWYDSSSAGAIKTASYLSEHIDLNICVESDNLPTHFSRSNKYLFLWSPCDSKLFFIGEEARDIPVSFLGSTTSYRSMRREYLEFVKEHIDLYHKGGQTESLLSWSQYAEILRRSKISLGFSFSVDGTHQIKGRVFEILFSGALLIENENHMTKQFFKPMVDYVSFDSKNDLVDKIFYYLEHDEERREIAYNGHLKATTHYNAEIFWKIVMKKLKELNVLA